MAKTRAEKKETLDKLEKSFRNSKLVVFSEVKGLNVSDTMKLRGLLRKEGIAHTVAKISLIKIALKRCGWDASQLKLQTQVATTASVDDTSAARVIKKFSRTNDKIKLLCGYADGKFLNQEQVLAVATMPTRLELLARLVGTINGLNRGLVTVLNGNLTGLVRVLSQVKR